MCCETHTELHSEGRSGTFRGNFLEHFQHPSNSRSFQSGSGFPYLFSALEVFSLPQLDHLCHFKDILWMYPFSSYLQNNMQLSSYGYMIAWYNDVILPSGFFFITPKLRCAFLSYVEHRTESCPQFHLFPECHETMETVDVDTHSVIVSFFPIYLLTQSFTFYTLFKRGEVSCKVLNFMCQQPDNFWLYTDYLCPT